MSAGFAGAVTMYRMGNDANATNVSCGLMLKQTRIPTNNFVLFVMISMKWPAIPACAFAQSSVSLDIKSPLDHESNKPIS